MVGTLKFEMQQWKEALELFGEARFVEVFFLFEYKELEILLFIFIECHMLSLLDKDKRIYFL
jgi:hypothetical protein